ncbi:MAG TPA: antitoxin MazE-like protein [Geminicoccaceae bacterium]|nr:antitoxin MazE-like protein [Geminicoccaceae bacterium]
MPQTGAEKMLDYRRRKREQGLRLVQLWAFDRELPEFQRRLRREAKLVRGHASTREANEFLGELLEERLAGPEAEGD